MSDSVNKNIFLLGFMGSGKSTIGKSLAKALKFKFEDLDDVIVNTVKSSIQDVFTQKGEQGFRDIETNCLRSFAKSDKPTVIALGGGAPCFNQNMEWINQNGISIYLCTDSDTLVDRLVQNNSERPLVAGKSAQQIREVVDALMAKRESFYNQATYIVDNSGGMSTAVNRIKKLLLS